jgi:hypothetical protein
MDKPVPRRLLREPIPGCDETLSWEQELPGEGIDPLFPFIPAGRNPDIGRVLVLEDEVPELVGRREPAATRRAVRSDDGDADTRIQQERGPGLHALNDHDLQSRPATEGGHRSERFQTTSQTAA